MKKLIGLCLTVAVVALLSFGSTGCGKDTKKATVTVTPTVTPTPGGGVTVTPTVTVTPKPT